MIRPNNFLQIKNMSHILPSTENTMSSTLLHLTSNDRIGVTGIEIAIIALIVSLINAAIAIWDFYLSRFSLLKVRKIRTYASQSVQDPQGSTYFEVEILSYGAAVWELLSKVVDEV
jgi:hypothetical protein